MFLWFADREERLAHPEVQACWMLGKHVAKVYGGAPYPVYCDFCDVLSLPVLDASFGSREQLCCDRCGLTARLRSSIALMEDVAPSPGPVYMTEQATQAFAFMQRRHATVVGSEFQPDPEARARLSEYLQAIGGTGEVEFGDVTDLGFASGSKGAVLSFEVLEHVPDYRAALREFARVLRPGGALIATFPFLDAQDTVARARLGEDGEIEHLMEPEYHGDPISGGVLCFYHFGWDVLDEVRAAGFSSAHMVMPWAPQRGFLYGMWNLVARR